jgi:uncharacterized protein with NRDE domain|tara:strand:- start:61 stop:846 length:786 start_codon:yes stop_codon:yes gene_type:complete
MCLIVLAHQLNADYPLIMAANRDEFRGRPTQNMHWWPNIEILAGKDLEAGGTWLALHRNGRWAAVTNFRKSLNQPLASFKTRGQLAVDFLSQSHSAIAFAKALPMAQFAGFNLLLWDNHELVFCSNEEAHQPQVLAAGLYGLSNGHLNSNWPKVEHVKKVLGQSLHQPPQHQALQQMMQHKAIAEDQNLPKTGLAIDWERRLSACFIDVPEYAYGTRTCISLYADRLGHIDVQETCFDHSTPLEQHFSWHHHSRGRISGFN